MRIAVTGATGFLGRQLCFQLRKLGYEAIGIGRNIRALEELENTGFTTLKWDLAGAKPNLDVLKGCSALVHCAGLSSPWGSWQQFYRDNVLATQNIYRAAVDCGIPKFIFTSTPSLYIGLAHPFDISETVVLPRLHVNLYARSKREAEDFLLGQDSALCKVVILRPQAIFGPGDTTLMPRLLRANQKFGVPIFDEKDFLLDLTYIDNVVNALVDSISFQASAHHIFNITNGEPVYFRDFLKKVFMELDIPLKFKKMPLRPIQGMVGAMELFFRVFLPSKEPLLTLYTLRVLSEGRTLDISRARSLLQYQPEVSMEEGARRFVSWWRKNQT